MLGSPPVASVRYNDTVLNQLPEATRYFTRIMDILETPLPLKEGTQNELEPRRISLCSDAKSIWVKFHNHIESLCKEGRELHRIRGLAAKVAEHALRISGVLALLDDIQAKDIKSEYIEAAIELTQYYLSEALRLFEAVTDNPDLILAEKLLGWLKEKGYTQISLREIY